MQSVEWGVQRIPMLMLLTVTPAGVEPTTKLLVKGRGVEGGESTDFFLAIGDSSPPNTLLKQEGLQLAEASFRDMGIGLNGSSFEI